MVYSRGHRLAIPFWGLIKLGQSFSLKNLQGDCLLDKKSPKTFGDGIAKKQQAPNLRCDSCIDRLVTDVGVTRGDIAVQR